MLAVRPSILSLTTYFSAEDNKIVAFSTFVFGTMPTPPTLSADALFLRSALPLLSLSWFPPPGLSILPLHATGQPSKEGVGVVPVALQGQDILFPFKMTSWGRAPTYGDAEFDII